MCASRQRLTIDELPEILNIPPGTIVNSHGTMKAVQVRCTFRYFTSHDFRTMPWCPSRVNVSQLMKASSSQTSASCELASIASSSPSLPSSVSSQS